MDQTNETSRPLDEHEARVAELIGRYYEDDLQGTEADELADLLRDDASARRQFVTFGMGRSLLRRTLGGERVATEAADEVSRDLIAERPTIAGRIGASVRSPLLQAAVLAAAVTVFITVVANLGDRAAQQIAESEHVEPTAHAVITDVRNATWSGDAASIEPQLGTQISGGSIAISGGATQMVFASGAVVDVLGPAEFQIIGPKRGYLRSGRVLVWAPERAHGFTITTDSGDIVDLGTEFGVSVDASGAAEVHVLQGRVRAELRDDAAAAHTTELAEAQAVRLDGVSRTVAPVTIDAERFGRTIGSTTPPGPEPDHGVSINFDDHELLPYGRMASEWQDGQHGLPTSATVLDSGRTLKLAGNAWRMIELPYDVTERTVVSFDFRSTAAGQIHGFGFDSDNVYNREQGMPAIQVYGDETLPRIDRTYWNYRAGSGWSHYVIPVGKLHRGAMRYVYFLADDDIHGDADSYFRNVRIYESSGAAGADSPDVTTPGKGTR